MNFSDSIAIFLGSFLSWVFGVIVGVIVSMRHLQRRLREEGFEVVRLSNGRFTIRNWRSRR